MTNGPNRGAVPIGNRPGSWKRRLRIGDILVLIGLMSVDLALIRASVAGTLFALFPLLGLLAIMVGFVWRYVPRGWDRLGYVTALVLYLLFLGAFVAASNPFLVSPLARALGIQ
jgi:hypothetical protein